jgi:hypothetical protein
MAGNAVVLKPPSQGVVAGAHMLQCFVQAGLPKGLVNMVTGKVGGCVRGWMGAGAWVQEAGAEGGGMGHGGAGQWQTKQWTPRARAPVPTPRPPTPPLVHRLPTHPRHPPASPADITRVTRRAPRSATTSRCTLASTASPSPAATPASPSAARRGWCRCRWSSAARTPASSAGGEGLLAWAFGPRTSRGLTQAVARAGGCAAPLLSRPAAALQQPALTSPLLSSPLSPAAPNQTRSDADIDLAAKAVLKGGFSYSGQRCTAVKLVLVQKDVADALAAKVGGGLQQKGGAGGSAVGAAWRQAGVAAQQAALRLPRCPRPPTRNPLGSKS